jgi:hypothetical protein
MHHEVLNLQCIVVLLILIVSVSFCDICKEGLSQLYYFVRKNWSSACEFSRVAPCQ